MPSFVLTGAIEVANAAKAFKKPEGEVTQKDIDDLKAANDLLDSLGDLGDEGTGSRGLLPEASTNRTEETRNKFNLEGLLPTQQEELINNFVGNILSTLSLKIFYIQSLQSFSLFWLYFQ